MPELPEVETVRRGLLPLLEGEVLRQVRTGAKSLRTPWPQDFAARLEGRTVTRLDRRAKYLLLHLDDARVWLVHLGMSGAFRHNTSASFVPQSHDHLTFSTATATLAYNDPRRFGRMELYEQRALCEAAPLKNLGPEPLESDFTPEDLYAACQKRHVPIKVLLMEQRTVVGIGNIYAAESLFRARIHPAVLAPMLNLAQCMVLTACIRDTMNEAIAAGGSTLRNYHAPGGELGCFQHSFAVYGRKGAACACGKARIEHLVQAGRSSFFCPVCQPLAA